MRRTLSLNWAKSLVESYYQFVPIGEQGGVQAAEFDPGQGPLIALSNHTNGMVDGPILIRAARRRLCFLVKHQLFRMPVFGWIVKGTGAVPVYRRKDEVPTSWNDGVFDEIHRSLAAGQAIGIFPEGTSHLEAGIRPLRTGAARIALGAEEAAGWKLGIRILPVGIHYEDRDAFGSRVLAVVGKPVEVAPYRAQFRDAPRDAALELTANLHQALEGVRVELPEAEAAPLIGVVLDELRQGDLTPPKAAAALQHLVDGWRALARADEAKARGMLARLSELDRARRASGWRRTVERAVELCIALLWSPPLLVAHLLRRVLPLPVDKRATVLLLASSILFPLWILALAWIVVANGGLLWAGLTLLILFCSAAHAWRVSRAKRTRALPPFAKEERARIAQELREWKSEARIEDATAGS